MWIYTRGAELPSIAIEALDADKQPINFSTGWTFSVKVGEPGKAALVTVTTVTGSGTIPNLLIDWGPGVLDVLVTGVTYTVQLTATSTATGQARVYTTQLRILDAVL